MGWQTLTTQQCSAYALRAESGDIRELLWLAMRVPLPHKEEFPLKSQTHTCAL